MLVEHRVPVTLYVATDFVDADWPFPDDGAPLIVGRSCATREPPGWSGRVAHPRPRVARPARRSGRIEGELDRSIDLIGEQLGVPVRHFAYPKAVMGSPAAHAAVRARFDSAAVAGTHGRTGTAPPTRTGWRRPRSR